MWHDQYSQLGEGWSWISNLGFLQTAVIGYSVWGHFAPWCRIGLTCWGFKGTRCWRRCYGKIWLGLHRTRCIARIMALVVALSVSIFSNKLIFPYCFRQVRTLTPNSSAAHCSRRRPAQQSHLSLNAQLMSHHVPFWMYASFLVNVNKHAIRSLTT